MGRSWPERLRGDRIAMDRFEIRPLSPATVNDFRTRPSQPPEGWCWCVAWEVPTWEGWAERSAAPNRSLLQQLWAQGEFHGYFLYCDDDAIGPWRLMDQVHQRKKRNPSHVDDVPVESTQLHRCVGRRREMALRRPPDTAAIRFLQALRHRRDQLRTRRFLGVVGHHLDGRPVAALLDGTLLHVVLIRPRPKEAVARHETIVGTRVGRFALACEWRGSV